MAADGWQFFLDAGGTFTDCIAIPPDAPPRRAKVLSSGRLRVQVVSVPTADSLTIQLPMALPDRFFRHWSMYGERGQQGIADSLGGVVYFTAAHGIASGSTIDLSPHLPAPIVAIRLLAGLPLAVPIGRVQIRLGTTRATNALLERKVVRTALVTTAGFADLPEIGTQARPDLFALAIQKRVPLHCLAVEVEERIAVNGTIERSLDAAAARDLFADMQIQGIEAVAISLLHAWINPVHEEQLAAIAAEFDFLKVSISSRLSRTIGLLDRMDTTIADACLSPVLDRYIAEISQAAPQAELLLMTSAGALAPPGQFSGRDAILSGPAGGVIGLGIVAAQAACAAVIGFDMGGTSTDVSRYAGAPEYEQATEKAGIRIVAPTLAVHTVAAGGGSICGFDGHRLTVGPASAGAEPGPACYGRGGPLAVTDLNLYTGRVAAEWFPFPLSIAPVYAALDGIREMVRRAGGPDWSRDQVAAHFLQIADEKMAAAIHRITTARGVSPGSHALVSFGGAAAQHACAIADLLGITTVLQHCDAAILSAVGIGWATISRFAEQSLLQPLTVDTINLLQLLQDKEVPRLRHELAECGAEPQTARLTVTLDLRYQGENAAISILFDCDITELHRRFEAEHLKLNGHIQPGRMIEVASCRLELTAPSQGWQDPPVAVVARPQSTSRRDVIFGSQRASAAIVLAEQMQVGDPLMGPLVIHEPRSTIVVPPGWRAVRQVNGIIRLDRVATAAVDIPAGNGGHVAVEQTPDPAALELFANRFMHIATDMGLALQRSAISVNVRDRLDFSCAILDGTGRLIVNAPHIPVHLGAMGDAVRGLLASGKKLRPGDAWLSNDPDLGGSHLPDLTVMSPIFCARGERILFFAASRAHHAEIGGLRPGSCFPFPASLAEEGVLFRNFLLLRGGKLRESALLAALAAPPYPSRSPQENLADLRAQVAANHRGAAAIAELMAAAGQEEVLAYAGHLYDLAAQRCREMIRALPDGVYHRADALDSGAPIEVTLTVAGDRLLIDFTGTGEVNRDSLNANRAIVRSVVLYCLRCLIQAPVPLNDGVLDPVELRVPESFLAPPACADPALRAPTAGGNTEVSQRVADVILGALGVAAASQGTMNNLIFGNSRFGYYETICGGSGATVNQHGAAAVHTHMTNTRITDPERFEHAVPARLLRFAIRRGSGGQGLHRGGDGVIREIEFLEKLELSLLTQRRNTVPFGLAGGEPGMAGVNLLVRADGSRETLPALAQASVAAGDRLTLATPGGGGYGASAVVSLSCQCQPGSRAHGPRAKEK